MLGENNMSNKIMITNLIINNLFMSFYLHNQKK